MSGIARSIRVFAVVAVLAALAGACGKSITGPSPANGDGDPICIMVNGHLLCR
jgi:hypothetical protein